MSDFNLCLSFVVLFMAAMFPKEIKRVVLELEIDIRVVLLNVNLYVLQWIVYRRLRRDFAQYGIEMPPFEFKPFERPNPEDF